MNDILQKVRLAAIGDLHCSRSTQGRLRTTLAWVNEHADVLILCGDLTDRGTVEETRILVKELFPAVKIPIVGVLGNHDYEAGSQDEVFKILRGHGVQLLDGDTCEIRGVGFCGVKGFGGGFGQYALSSHGRTGPQTVRAFSDRGGSEVGEWSVAITHALADCRLALCADCTHGVWRASEIYPFLGSSRLEEPLTRIPVTLALHGHAHRGIAEGATSNGVPVFNVAVPVLRKYFPDQPPVRILQVDADESNELPEPSNVEPNMPHVASHT
ncbi:MAG: metallophosphoesterase [Polyangiaceae bacterium]|nr:metallophosphoesterase [Polyangiaceae bacterium]